MPHSGRFYGFYGLLFVIAATIGLTISDGFAQTQVVQTSSSSAESQSKNSKFAAKFWNYLLSNNYKHWSPPAGKSAGFTQPQNLQGGATSPHGNFVKLYVNRVAAGNVNAPPVGSILIMENYRSDKSLDTISVMYRTSGFNPNANDWFWADYKADGEVSARKLVNRLSGNGAQQSFAAAMKTKKLAGRVGSCIQCHRKAGTDLVFFNRQISPLKNQNTIQSFPVVPNARMGLKQ